MAESIAFIDITSDRGRIGNIEWSNDQSAKKRFNFLSGTVFEFDPDQWHSLVTSWIDALVKSAKDANGIAYGECNEIFFEATPLTTPGKLHEFYLAENKRLRDEYLASPRHKYLEQKEQEEQAKKEQLFSQMLELSPQVPTFKDPDAWQGWVGKNCDSHYGMGVLTFADYWARFMEYKISQGAQLKDVAGECSSIADTDGITGFMYGCAVNILSRTWIHGEELRCWHNIKTQIGTEGETANENGEVLNPAIFALTT